MNRYANPLPNITKKTDREKEAFKIKERKPKKKKKEKDLLINIRRLKTTRVAWLKRYVPVAISTAIQERTKKNKIPRYSNWAIAGFASLDALESGNLKLYAVIAEKAIARLSGINIRARIATCCGFARSFKRSIRGFFKAGYLSEWYQL